MELGLGRALHLGDIPGHERMQIFVSPKSHMRGHPVERQVLDFILGLGLRRLLLVTLVQSAHRCKRCSAIPPPSPVARCVVG